MLARKLLAVLRLLGREGGATPAEMNQLLMRVVRRVLPLEDGRVRVVLAAFEGGVEDVMLDF